MTGGGGVKEARSKIERGDVQECTFLVHNDVGDLEYSKEMLKVECRKVDRK